MMNFTEFYTCLRVRDAMQAMLATLLQCVRKRGSSYLFFAFNQLLHCKVSVIYIKQLHKITSMTYAAGLRLVIFETPA